MDYSKKYLCIKALIIIFCIFFIYQEADAQMRVAYPTRFRITGLVELIYTNYQTDTKRSSTGWSTFEENYVLGLEGYVYHPRLAVFSTGITFRDLRSITGVKYTSDVVEYNISATFLPYRPLSVDLYAIKTYYKVKTAYNDKYDINTNNYGARIKYNPRNRLPLMRLEYSHFDTTSGLNEYIVKIDRYDLDVRGYSEYLKTRYGLSLGFSDISRPNQSYRDKYLNGYTDSNIIGERLKNYFRYHDNESSKTISFTSNLDFKPGRRFIHDYWYQYNNAEHRFGGDEEATGFANLTKKYSQHSLTGTWGYKFTDRLRSSLSLNYGSRKEDSGSSSFSGISAGSKSIPFYGIHAGLSYSRPVAGIDTSSAYGFIFRKDKAKGSFNEHSLDIRLSTRRFRWATIYANYSLVRSELVDRYLGMGSDEFFQDVKERKTQNTIHSIRFGVRGKLRRGISRGFWNLEAEYYNSTSHIQRPMPESEDIESGDIEKWTEKIRQYSVTGELQYPVLKVGLVNFKTGYSKGDTEIKGISRGYNKFFGDLRFSYPISRRMSFLAWWSEIWSKYEGIPDFKTRNYMLELRYRMGRIFLSLEVEVLRELQSDSMIQRRRIYLKLRRPIG